MATCRPSGSAPPGTSTSIAPPSTSAPTCAWRNKPIRALIEQATQLSVVVENDANAAAYGELAHGGGAGPDDMVMVTLYRLGGGIISNVVALPRAIRHGG